MPDSPEESGLAYRMDGHDPDDEDALSWIRQTRRFIAATYGIGALHVRIRILGRTRLLHEVDQRTLPFSQPGADFPT